MTQLTLFLMEKIHSDFHVSQALDSYADLYKAFNDYAPGIMCPSS